MSISLEDVKRRLTADLISYGHFINYVDGDLLKKAIGNVISVDYEDGESAEINGILVAMKMRYFFPSKMLITFITLKKSQRMLLRIFLNTLREKFNIGINWRIILVPFKERNGSLELYNMAASFADLRFIDFCRSEGVKILDRTILFPLASKLYNPIEISSNDQFCVRLTKKLFNPLNRNDYIKSQSLMKDLFNANIQDANIKRTTVAQFIFSAIESYDYYHTLDVVDKINPFYVFNNKLKERIDRENLRNFVNDIFIRLMINFDWDNDEDSRLIIKHALRKYSVEGGLRARFQTCLKELFKISEIGEIINDLIDWRVFIQK